MYRPKKRKLVRRLGATSLVVALAAAGATMVVVAQSGASSVGPKALAGTTTASSVTPMTKVASSKYFVVAPDDARASRR